MEKYGWSKGQGLGANEDGMTEHIKIRAKSDGKGKTTTPMAMLLYYSYIHVLLVQCSIF